VTPLAWYERYSRRIEESRLPKDTAAREAYAQMVGEDGFHFLDALYHTRLCLRHVGDVPLVLIHAAANFASFFLFRRPSINESTFWRIDW
jgi:hypothetical protein